MHDREEAQGVALRPRNRASWSWQCDRTHPRRPRHSVARGQLAKDWDHVRPALLIGLTNGALYALVALGYTLVYGILELIDFAHGDVFMIGGMIPATVRPGHV